MSIPEIAIDERLASIRERLAVRLAQEQIIGERGIGPCLPLEEIEKYERRNGVRLPEGYRRFLLEIGNGGYGPPERGLVALDPQEDNPDLTKLYPFTESCYTEPWEDASEGHPDRIKYESIAHGVLYLGARDDEDDWVLVVTGDEHGQIWIHSTLGITPLAPRRDFLSWYIYWLDGGSDWWAELEA
jgi:hypothetical protein